MVVIWYLLMLAPVIAIAVFWWNYRRKQAARERLASERWQQLVSKAGKPEKEIPAEAVAAAAAAIPQKAMPSNASQSYRGRERLLEPADTLFYFLLRTQLPEYEVLTAVSLGRLLVTGAASEQERERMARGLDHPQGDPQTDQRLAKHHDDRQAVRDGVGQLEARGQEVVERSRVVDQAAENHGDHIADRATAHGRGQQFVPRIPPLIFGQRFVGERLIGTAGTGFRQTGENAVQDAEDN